MFCHQKNYKILVMHKIVTINAYIFFTREDAHIVYSYVLIIVRLKAKYNTFSIRWLRSAVVSMGSILFQLFPILSNSRVEFFASGSDSHHSSWHPRMDIYFPHFTQSVGIRPEKLWWQQISKFMSTYYSTSSHICRKFFLMSLVYNST